MATTVIDTTAIPPIKGSNGSSAEILNRELCGATYSRGTLRWLQDGERFDVRSDVPAHQLIYFLDGKGAIKLDTKEYEVEKGGGVYLAPSETASIIQVGSAPLKVFHLTVPKKLNFNN